VVGYVVGVDVEWRWEWFLSEPMQGVHRLGSILKFRAQNLRKVTYDLHFLLQTFGFLSAAKQQTFPLFVVFQ